MAVSSQCTFFLKCKGRYCRMSALLGTPFCGEHILHWEVHSQYVVRMLLDTSQDSNCMDEVFDVKRILCPIDSSQ